VRRRLIDPMLDLHDPGPNTVHRLPFRRRRHHHLVAGSPAILSLGLAACGDDSPRSAARATTEPVTSTTAPAERPNEPIDGSIAIAGGQMHLRCEGEGPSTVLLLAGWGGSGDNWGAIEP
jgi:pimeloyl-ACP methyl ester carboxylesterase